MFRQFIIYRSQLKVAGLGCALVFAAACSSSSELPDPPPTETPQYQSVSEGSPESGKGPTATNQSSPPTQNSPAPDSVSGVPKATGPVALVDGKPVTAEEFNEQMTLLVRTGQVPPQHLSKVSEQLVQRLVDKHLMEMAIASEGVEVTQDEVDAKIEEWQENVAKLAATSNGGPAPKLDQLLAKQGIREDEFRESIEQLLAVEKIVRQRGVESPKPNEIRQFYEDNKEYFKRPEQIHARHILIKVSPDASEQAWQKAKAEALTVYEEVTAPNADFAEVAKRRSQGPSSSQGGDLGFFSRGATQPAIEEVAFGQEAGKISKPVRSQAGWHIIQTIEHRPASVAEFDEVKAKLTQQLEGQALQKHLMEYLEQLRDAAKVEYKLENIEG